MIEKIKDKLEDMFFWPSEYFKRWIYPGHYLKNILFNRYDLVKMKNIKAWEYCDIPERMLYSNMELICHFIEKEDPENVVEWYNENEIFHCKGNISNAFPELEGKYVIDIIKSIYFWWKIDLPKLIEEEEYILSFWHDNLCSYEVKDNYIVFNEDYDNEKIDESKINWNIIDKYVEGDRKNIFKKGFVLKKHLELENKIDEDTQYYLHLCILIRHYLWV